MMSACIRADRLTLDVPLFLQRERSGSGWKDLFLGAAFDPPRRRLTRLLDDVSFEIGEGDRLAILGRNGAGKSTLLRVLNRRSEEHTSELQSLMRISYAVFFLKKKNKPNSQYQIVYMR